MKKLFYLFAFLLVFLLIACNESPIDVISHIEITNQEEIEKTYFVGDEYELPVVNLTIYYADGRSIQRDSATDSSIIIDTSSVDMSKSGTYEIRVSYTSTEINTSYNITVIENEIQSIRITKYPDKLTYEAPEKISLDGLEIEAVWKNGDIDNIVYSKENAPLFTCNPSTVTSSGNIKVYYGGCFDSFYVEYSITLSNVELVSEPEKKTYNRLEPVDLTGLVLKEIYSDGSVREVEWISGNDDFSVSPAYISQSGKVTVTYKEYNFSYNVEFEPILNSITIENKPNKLVYEKIEAVDLTGLVLRETYSDESYELIEYSEENASQFSVSPAEVTESTTIKVEYNGETIEFDVEFKPVIASVSIKANPSKEIYNSKEAVDLSGFVVSVTWSDESVTEVSYDETPDAFSIISPDLVTSDNTSVIVIYEGFELNFTVTYSPEVERYSIKEKPQKTEYDKPSNVDLTGLVITEYMTDGTSRDITYSDENASDFTASPKEIDGSSSFEIVYIYYKGENAGLFRIDYEVKFIGLTAEINNHVFYAGDELQSYHFNVWREFSDGTRSILLQNKVDIEEGYVLGGEQEVVLTTDYGDVTVTINGIGIESLTASVSSNDFNNSNKLSDIGYTLSAKYTDGTERNIIYTDSRCSIENYDDEIGLVDKSYDLAATYIGKYKSNSISLTANNYVDGSTWYIYNGEGLWDWNNKIHEGLSTEGMYVELESDVTLDTGLNPISFSGVFDGNNHTISNMKAGSTSTRNGKSGFIASLFGEIRDLTIEAVLSFSGDNNYVGVVAGGAYNAIIENVIVKGTIEHHSVSSATQRSYIGGIVGYAQYGSSIIGCVSYVDIDSIGSDIYAGIAGHIGSEAIVMASGNSSENVRAGIAANSYGTLIGCFSTYGAIGNETPAKIDGCYYQAPEPIEGFDYVGTYIDGMSISDVIDDMNRALNENNCSYRWKESDDSLIAVVPYKAN